MDHAVFVHEIEKRLHAAFRCITDNSVIDHALHVGDAKITHADIEDRFAVFVRRPVAAGAGIVLQGGVVFL